MRSAFFLLPGILPALSACGRGGATLETDNVQAEWFPNGSRTAIVLEGESEPVSEREIRHPHSGMTLFYHSLGDGRGTLEIAGGVPETATVTYSQGAASAELHFKTASREILLNDVRRPDANEKTAFLNGWSSQERGTALRRLCRRSSASCTKAACIRLRFTSNQRTWKIPCALLLAGVLALACVQCSVRSLAYLPPQPKDKTAYLEKRAAWEPHRRTFHHNGAKLSGWLIEKKGQPLLVYYGGNAMDISMMLPYLDRFPHAKLLVNYRGYGLSTGSPTEQDIMGDSLAILDSVLKETGRTPDDVILVGQSLGSGVATQVASVRHVKKLVLLVPFDSLLETARGLFPYLPVRLLLPDHFRSDLAAPKVACPVSILAAGADEVIPPHHAKRLRDCFSVPVSYQEFPGAMHNTIWLSPGFDKAFSQSIGY